MGGMKFDWKNLRGASPERRLFSRVRIEPNGCWEWKGVPTCNGYGRIKVEKPVLVHRFSYEFFKGPIPEGLQIDHLCGNKICVNPAHLEAVTQWENMTRAGTQVSVVNGGKTHCKRGHEFTPENIYRQPGKPAHWRICRTCERERTQRRRKSVGEELGWAA